MRSLKKRVWRLWWHYVRWPMPLWRLRHRARITIGGHRFHFVKLRPAHYLAWARMVRSGEWEPHVIQYLIENARPGDVVLDVGAYVGGYSLLASRLVEPTGHVYAFEPDPLARRVFEANVRANAITNITVVAKAVSDQAGVVRFAGVGDSMSRISTDGSSVEAITLNSFCREHGIEPAIVKIDIEGAEARALVPAACDETLQQARAAVVEVHEHRGASRSVVESAARAAGKACCVIGPTRRSVDGRGRKYHMTLS